MRHRCDYDDKLRGSCGTNQDYALFLIARAIEDLVVEVRRLRQGASAHTIRIEIMPKTVQVGGTAIAHVTAAKADGTPFLITSADTVSLAGDPNATFGTPVVNADGSVDIPITATAVDASDSITATVDGTVSAPDTLTVTAAGPVTVTLAIQ